MRNRVFAVSIDSSQAPSFVAFYRTDGTESGGGVTTYSLTVDRLIRLTRAMVSTAVVESVTIYDRPGWVNWMLHGRLADQILKLARILEEATLG